jgi:GTPase
MQIAPAEIEDGNIEYKRHFINVTDSRLNHLTAQMNWRINEGNGVCYYYIGICDNGTLYENLLQEEIDYSLDIIKLMAEGCNSYIETIIINRVKDNLWLNITIKRNHAYVPEYRILVESNSNIKRFFKNKTKSKDIFFNSVIHDNERYLFFQCNKKMRTNIEKLIDFNLIININININYLMNYVENNMNGNNINDNDDVIFNIIKSNHIQSIGYILFGYLKQGKIKNGMEIEYKNQKVQILSIHNNYIDCTEATAPATISLRIINIKSTKLYHLDNCLQPELNQGDEIALHQDKHHKMKLQKA